MQISKIKIENFKSIKEIEFDLQKHGSSYTTMLVGINESGKSNILEAMSYFDTPKEKFDYNVIHNQKDQDGSPIVFEFFMAFEQRQTCVNEIRKGVENGELLNFEVEDIVKIVSLADQDEMFSSEYLYEIEKMSKGLFIKKIQNNSISPKGESVVVDSFILRKDNDIEESFQELTLELFNEIFSKKIISIIRQYEPRVSLWRPSEKYLVSEVDLKLFKDNIHSNIPLRHIFYIAGFKDSNSIRSEIERIGNHSLRRKLQGILGTATTNYVKNIWQHNIIVDIEITENSTCVVSIRDDGKYNEYNFHKMTARSEGFKQFMSLILSLSVETKFTDKKNNLILIDEPEAHLHPSGIRDLRKELLAIGEKNYLFVSTHSPFLVDRKNKERNVIIKKNKFAETEKILIDKDTSIIDDEVLREAFGIEVYKDLLNPHRILVEGASDKMIIQKALSKKDLGGYGITNSHGSNIVTLAEKLNDTDIPVFIILDDDEDGRSYKRDIIKSGGSYSANTVVTIRDLVGDIVDKGTIEDVLGKSFLESEIGDLFKITFPKHVFDFQLDKMKPVLEDLRIYLYSKGFNKKIVEDFLEKLKIKISSDFEPSQTSLIKNFPLLNTLIEQVRSRLV